MHPGARRLDFDLASPKGLYRNFAGATVVVDVEGSGQLLTPAEPNLSWWVDGEMTAHATHFERSLLAVRTIQPAPEAHVPEAHSSTGPIATVLLGGTPPCMYPSPLPVGNQWNGVGWVIEADGECCVDGLTYAVPPIPVVHQATGRDLHIVPSPFTAVTLDEFAITEAATHPARQWQAQRLSRPETLTAPDPDPSQGPLTAEVAEALNGLQFTVTVPPGSVGLRLERLYDQFFGRQRLRVVVDGVPVGFWFDPHQDRYARWARSAFGWSFPAPAPGGPMRLLLDPPAGVPLWSVARLRVIAWLPASPPYTWGP